MKHTVHSHSSGDSTVPAHLRREIEAAITAITAKVEKGAAPRIRDEFLNGVHAAGWSSEVPVAQGTNITITSMKAGTGLCLQTGNMSRMYADLMKLQTLYLDGSISSAIIVVPAKPVAKLIGDNIAEATRLERELDIFRKAYNVPTLLYALE
jgi:hypothetical protein